ncbi:hypothetical protein X728_09090 [Mesorhizobium sp. L103C120A0]|nr:hypothetical protein X728_09090 [Mesorhizobium sp. L103C120A0]
MSRNYLIDLNPPLGAARMKSVILTAADHERNGFVALAKWSGLNLAEAKAFIDATDATVCDDSEPDSQTAPFTFILDLMDDSNGDLLDTGKRMLPMQTAMALAPAEVRHWLEERPDPDSVMHRRVPEANRAAILGA